MIEHLLSKYKALGSVLTAAKNKTPHTYRYTVASMKSARKKKPNQERTTCTLFQIVVGRSKQLCEQSQSDYLISGAMQMMAEVQTAEVKVGFIKGGFMET